MSKKLKNAIIFGIFIIILFISTLTSAFNAKDLWSFSSGIGSEFEGLLFTDPADIKDLTIQKSIEKDDGEDIIKYNIEFNYEGAQSSLRIIGTPIRHVFFDGDVTANHSEVILKGDYDKINEKLFNEKLSLKEYYKKNENYDFLAKSQIKIPLEEREDPYSFSLYYRPRDLVYKNKKTLASTSVFITNARIDKFTNSQKLGENKNIAFSESGFYINAQEIKDDMALSKISLLNNLTNIIFIASVIAVIALIVLNKKSLSKLFIPLFMLIILTFYRFLGMGSSTLAILILFPILSFISTCLAKLMTKDTMKLTNKDLKQALAYTIIFFMVLLIIVVIPRAI